MNNVVAEERGVIYEGAVCTQSPVQINLYTFQCVYNDCSRSSAQWRTGRLQFARMCVGRALVVLTVVLCSGVCALPRVQTRGFASAKHVIIFGCDGFGEKF